MIGTPRNERYGSSPASRKYLKRGCAWRRRRPAAAAASATSPASPSVRPHAHAADALGSQPDGRGEHQARAIRLEQVDRADVGGEPPLDQVDDVAERLGGIAALRHQPADFFERPEE